MRRLNIKKIMATGVVLAVLATSTLNVCADDTGLSGNNIDKSDITDEEIDENAPAVVYEENPTEEEPVDPENDAEGEDTNNDVGLADNLRTSMAVSTLRKDLMI